MTTPINVHDAKTNFAKFLDRAHAREEVVLAKADKPCARLVPLAPAATHCQPGRLRGRVTARLFVCDEELDGWEPRRCGCCWTPTFAFVSDRRRALVTHGSAGGRHRGALLQPDPGVVNMVTPTTTAAGAGVEGLCLGAGWRAETSMLADAEHRPCSGT